MEKKRTKIVEFIETHEKQIIKIGATVMSVAAMTVIGGVLWRHSEAGKFINLCETFGKEKRTGKSMVEGLTDFLTGATRSVHPWTAQRDVMVSEFGEDFAKVMKESCGIEPTALVSGVLIGIKK